MIKKQLETLFGVSFTLVDSLPTLRQFHYTNAYCLDEAGALYGLCVTDLTVENLEIPDFPALVYLNLSDHKLLRKLYFSTALAHLEHLDLSDGGLTTLKLQPGFKQLRWLDVSRNNLAALTLQGQFNALHYLDLSDNALKDFPGQRLAQFPQLAHLFLQKNDLPSAKQSAATASGSCLAFMQGFLRDLQQDGKTPNKEVKVLLVGNGGVGKSCLVERLVYGTFEQRHLSTHGVALEQYLDEEGGYPFVLNLWDFGGQDLYHATHRLFMESNAIYLALWNEDDNTPESNSKNEASEEDEYPNYPLSYWLHYIRELGGKSPIIVVKTFRDNSRALHPQQPELQKRYQVHDFLQLDSGNEKHPKANGFSKLLSSIEEVIHDRLGIEKELPQNWANLRQHLRRLQRSGTKLLSLDEYYDIESDYKIDSASKVLQNWLVPTGVVFHRPGYFAGAIILQQDWAIEAAYSLLERKSGLYHQLRDKKTGQLSGKEIQEIWQSKSYSQAEQELLVNFMLTCEICFEIKPAPEEEGSTYIPFAQRQFIVPQLLTKTPPTSVEMLRAAENMLYVKYRHDFLHQGIIQSFIVRTHALADTRDIWQQGIVLKENGEYAMVAAVPAPEHGAHAFDIEVVCSQANLPLLDKIRNTLEELQGEAVNQWVSVDGQQFVDMDRLQKWQHETIPTVDDQSVLLTKSFEVFSRQREQTKFQLPVPASHADTKQLMQQMDTEALQKSNIPYPPLDFTKAEGCILFAQANPTTKDIDWETEYAALAKSIAGRQRQKEIQLNACPNASLDHLLDAIENHKPGVIHFSGYGQKSILDRTGQTMQKSGLLLHSEDLTGQEILGEAELTQRFQAIKADQPQLQIVLLNASHSKELAAAISVPGLYAIGLKDEITPLAARRFVTGFYRGLAEGQDVLLATKRGLKRGAIPDEEVGVYYQGHCIYPAEG